MTLTKQKIPEKKDGCAQNLMQLFKPLHDKMSRGKGTWHNWQKPHDLKYVKGCWEDCGSSSTARRGRHRWADRGKDSGGHRRERALEFQLPREAARLGRSSDVPGPLLSACHPLGSITVQPQESEPLDQPGSRVAVELRPSAPRETRRVGEEDIPAMFSLWEVGSLVTAA